MARPKKLKGELEVALKRVRAWPTASVASLMLRPTMLARESKALRPGHQFHGWAAANTSDRRLRPEASAVVDRAPPNRRTVTAICHTSLPRQKYLAGRTVVATFIATPRSFLRLWSSSQITCLPQVRRIYRTPRRYQTFHSTIIICIAPAVKIDSLA